MVKFICGFLVLNSLLLNFHLIANGEFNRQHLFLLAGSFVAAVVGAIVDRKDKKRRGRSENSGSDSIKTSG